MSRGLGARQRQFLRALAGDALPLDRLLVKMVRQSNSLAADCEAVWNRRIERERGLTEMLQSLGMLGPPPRKDWSHNGGRYRTRPAAVEGALNPSRVIAGLVKRGLVERGPLGYLLITEAGLRALE